MQSTIISLSQKDDAVDADFHDDADAHDNDNDDADDEDGDDEEVLCKAKLFTRLFHLDSGSY